jgi:AbrB family looped-hinge helix DNA binding protein
MVTRPDEALDGPPATARSSALNKDHGRLHAMDTAIETSIDGAGRIVIPKAIRQQAGFQPGTLLTVRLREGRIEIEPSPREVRIVTKGSLRVASPVLESGRLTVAEVERTRRALRERHE